MLLNWKHALVAAVVALALAPHPTRATPVIDQPNYSGFWGDTIAFSASGEIAVGTPWNDGLVETFNDQVASEAYFVVLGGPVIPVGNPFSLASSDGLYASLFPSAGTYILNLIQDVVGTSLELGLVFTPVVFDSRTIVLAEPETSLSAPGPAPALAALGFFAMAALKRRARGAAVNRRRQTRG